MYLNVLSYCVSFALCLGALDVLRKALLIALLPKYAIEMSLSCLANSGGMSLRTFSQTPYFKLNFDVLTLYLSILLLCYTSEGDIVFFLLYCIYLTLVVTSYFENKNTYMFCSCDIMQNYTTNLAT